MVAKSRQTPAATEAADNDEWETIPTGSLGNEWDFDRDGALIGNYLGSRTVETAKLESGEATAHLFAPIGDPESVVFLWESADLAGAFRVDGDGTSLIRVGDKVRVTFLGERAFTAANGQPRRIKQYRVEAAKRV
jgi:hypothetical protein